MSRSRRQTNKKKVEETLVMKKKLPEAQIVISPTPPPSCPSMASHHAIDAFHQSIRVAVSISGGSHANISICVAAFFGIVTMDVAWAKYFFGMAQAKSGLVKSLHQVRGGYCWRWCHFHVSRCRRSS